MGAGYWIVASLAIMVIAISKAGFGGGPGALATPIMATVVDPRTAVSVMLPIMLVCDLWCVRTYHKGVVWGLVFKLLAGFSVGVVIATYLLSDIPNQEVWLRMAIGILAVSFGSFSLVMIWRREGVEKCIPQGLWFGLLMGAVAGVSSTLAHAGGPPVAMYLMSQARGRERASFMGTIVVFTLLGNLLKVPSYLVSGAMTIETLKITWPLALIAPLGLLLGRRLNIKVGPHFQVWVNGLLILVGVYLLFS